MDQSEWGARQQARDERNQPGGSAIETRANWINAQGPLDVLGALVWHNETEFTNLCAALAEAGPTLSTGDARLMYLGNALAFQALHAMSGGDYECAGQFVRSLDGAMDYCRSVRASIKDDFRTVLVAFDDALWKSIEKKAEFDLKRGA